MEKECEERLEKIVEGFRECRNAFTAIGDETRQLILLVLLESDLSGIRVGEIAKKSHLTRPSVSHHLQILKEAGINPDTRVKDLTEEDEAKLREVIANGYTVEGDLRRDVAMDIKRLTEIGCYRGMRHRKGLPVRGQRSKTNARTRKGPKRTVANKKK